jgi:hypothetical protein
MNLSTNSDNFSQHNSAAGLCNSYALLSARQEINSYLVFKGARGSVVG